jgi:hypothetical protein
MLSCVGVVSLFVYAAREKLRWLKTESKSNLRIILGMAQVLSLLPAVLELVFPQAPKAAISFAAIFVADLRDLLRFECWGTSASHSWSWYSKWVVSLTVTPILAFLPFFIRWGWRHIRKQSRDSARARREASELARAEIYEGLAFVVMLLYPQISSAIFSALRCRSLGETSTWLEADYSVDCGSQRYKKYRTIAVALVVVVPVGIPCVLFATLIQNRRHSTAEFRKTRRSDGQQPPGSQFVFEMASYRHQKAQKTFGFVVDDFQPEFYWYEPIDMLRKLMLSGLLQFVHRGTAAQCFCGCAVAFLSFGIQLWLGPYREREANLLKALVDMQLFLTFLVSFILRVLPLIETAEPAGQDFYGWLLLLSIAWVVCAGVGLTAMQILRRQKETSPGAIPDSNAVTGTGEENHHGTALLAYSQREV